MSGMGEASKLNSGTSSCRVRSLSHQDPHTVYVCVGGGVFTLGIMLLHSFHLFKWETFNGVAKSEIRSLVCVLVLFLNTDVQKCERAHTNTHHRDGVCPQA